MLKAFFASTFALSVLMAPVVAHAKACRDTDTGRYVKCAKAKPVRCRDGQSGKFVKCSTTRPTRCRDAKGRFTSCTSLDAVTDASGKKLAVPQTVQPTGAQTPAPAAPAVREPAMAQ